MERVANATSYLRRCCQAFADLCCAKYSHAGATSCCSVDCSDEKTPLLGDHHVTTSPNEITTVEGLVGASCAKTKSDVPERDSKREFADTTHHSFTLEIGGMDCIDCLNKIKRAFKQLRGATATRMDYVRAVIKVEYDPGITDPEAIAIFVSRATGFTATASKHDLDESSTRLEMTLEFAELPPPNSYEHLGTHEVQPQRSWWSPLSRGGQISLSLADDRDSAPEPRKILEILAPYQPRLVQSDTRHERQAAKDLSMVVTRTIVSTVLTIPILVLVWATQLPMSGSKTFATVQFILATGIIAIAFPIYSSSFRSAIYLHEADLGVLVTVSTLTTYIFSVIAYIFHLADHPFAETLFETLGLLVTLIYIGRTLQHVARRAALRAVSGAGPIRAETALLVGERGRAYSSGQSTSIHPSLLHYDDIIRLLEEDIVPTDGVVLWGSGAIDEAAITGESTPVLRSPGSTVLAGSTIKEGTLDIQVTRLQSNNSLSAIIRSLSSQDSSSQFYDLADRLAGWLLWIAIGAGLASFLVWLFVARFTRYQSWAQAVTLGIKHFIAVMAVACPCALVLSVSLVAATGLSLGLRHKIAFRSLAALFNANSIEVYAFDKTGTLSQGVLTVFEKLHENTPVIDQIAYELASSNRHPISKAIKRHLEETGGPWAAANLLSNIEVVPGRGVHAELYGYTVVAGNAEYTGSGDHPKVQAMSRSGHSVFLITLGNRLIGGYGLLDPAREGVMDLLGSLRPAHCVVLSGDNPHAVNRFATGLDIEAIGGLSPSGKAADITRLAGVYGKVAFVGDGTNDALALAAADLSVAVGSGSEIATSAASIVLLDSNVPHAFQVAIRIAKTTRLHLFLGFAWCVVYFTFAILLAAGAFVKFSIPPEWAGLGEVVSVAPLFILSAIHYLD